MQRKNWPTTQRLQFRNYQPADLDWLYEMSADEEVMRYFETTLDLDGTTALYHRLKNHIDLHRFGFWAVELVETAEPVGMIGLGHPRFDPSLVEIGWRLRKKYWNHGLATEGAIACLTYGFDILGLNRIWSWTTVDNIASERVMQKIGMQKYGYFNHPNVTPGHRTERHVQYIMDKT